MFVQVSLTQPMTFVSFTPVVGARIKLPAKPSK